MRRLLRPLLGALALLLTASAPACARQTVEEGEAALRAGRYDDAVAVFRSHLRSPGAATVARKGLVRALLEVGRYDDAEAAAREGAASSPELLTALGEALRRRGKREEAERAFRHAIERQASDRLVAELNLAVLLHERGERESAARGFDRFIDVYNGSGGGRLTAAELTAVGTAVRYLGAEEPQLFKDALRAYDEAAAADTAALEPKLRAGELFLEKYNSADARASFREVLEVNPRHPAALLGLARVMEFDGEPGAADLARQALETNPNLAPAHSLLARLSLEGEDFDGAERGAAQALEIDPTSIEALAVLAAARYLRGDHAGYEEVRRRASSLYPRSAELLATVAELSVQNRHYRGAAELAAAALALDPRSWRAQGILGINQLRLGRMAEGRASLEAAFRGDPYNVWYKNTLDLLDALAGYREHRTEHFQFVLHGREADLLGPYAGALAEEAFAKLAERYGYRPEAPIRVEVYPRHADFSVRTVGLVGLGALGVSFGRVLAMDSPAARERGEFNWGATLWHETAHAFHLGMTDHRLPRWLAEGLAVHEERQARPGWGHDPDPGFLAAFAEGRLAPVSRLNDGIVRPSYPNQVVHSYYQASLVVEMIERDHGFPALRAMLRAYGRGATTPEVFREALGTEPAEFDARFDAWLRERFAGPLAALDGDAGFPTLLDRGRRLLEAGRPDDAVPFLERAKTAFPEYAGPGSPYRLLAGIHAARGELRRAADELERLTSLNENDYDAHFELAGLLERLGDRAGAAAALERLLYIHPYDIELHDRLAGLYAGLGDAHRVVRERRAVLALDPVDRAGAHYRLALALRDAGDPAAARREVLRALETAPNFAEAQELLLELPARTGGGVR